MSLADLDLIYVLSTFNQSPEFSYTQTDGYSFTERVFFLYLIYGGRKLKVFHKISVRGAPNDVCCRVNLTYIGYMVTRIKFLLLNDVMFGEWAVFLNLYRCVPDMLLQAAVGVTCVFSVKLFWHIFSNPLLSSPLRALARHLVL